MSSLKICPREQKLSNLLKLLPNTSLSSANSFLSLVAKAGQEEAEEPN
jgi:hypothetical protein